MRFAANHFVASAEEDGDGARVLALFDDEHAVLGRAERQLAHDARLSQLVGRQLREARHDSAAGRNSNQLQQQQDERLTYFISLLLYSQTNLDFGSAHPSDSGQLSVK